MRTLRIGLIILAVIVQFSVSHAQSFRSDELFAQGVSLYNQKKYADAIVLFEQVKELDDKELSETSARRGYGDLWLAACYYKMGNETKANEIVPFSYMVPPVDRRLTVESDRQSDQAMFFYSAENYERALEYFQRCAVLELKNIGRHSFYANSLRMCAECLMYMDNFDEAKSQLFDALPIYRKEQCDYAVHVTQETLGTCYYYMGQADSACHYFEEARRGFQSVGASELADNILLPLKTCRAIVAYTEGNPEAKNLFVEVKTALEQKGYTSGYDYNKILYYLLGCSYFLDSDWNQAYKTGIQLRQRYEQEQLTMTAEYIDILHITVMAGGHSQRMNLEEAIEQEELILKLVRDSQGTDNEYYVRSLQYLANLNSNTNPGLALQQAQEAYDIVKRSKEQLTPQTVALVYQMMALIYANNMELDKATEMFDKAYGVYQDSQVPITGDYTALLSNIVSLYSNIDRFDNAAAAGEQVIRIYKTYNWHADNTYVATLAALLNVYDMLGNTKRLKELIAVIRQTYQDYPSLSKANYNYIHFLQKEANQAIIEGNLSQAIANAEEMLAMAGADNNTDADFKTMLETGVAFLLAQCYNAQGETEKAWETIREMREIELEGGTVGDKQYASVMGLALKSVQKMINGDYEGAMAQIRTSLRQYEELDMGENNPMRLILLNGLTTYAWNAGDRPTLMQAVTEQNTFFRRFVRSHFQTMTYQERCDFWGKYNSWFNVQLPNAAYRLSTDTMHCELYNGLLLSKGLLLNSEIELKLLIDESGDMQARQLYNRFVQHKTQLARLQAERLSKAQCDSLSEVIYSEEKEVMLMLNEKFGDYTKRLDVTWNDVQQHLKPDEAAIEFVLSPLSPDSLLYSALVLRPGYDVPHFVPLFMERQLTDIPANRLYKSTEAGKLVWASLTEELSDVHRIYFSPVGKLHSIGLESLPIGSDDKVAGERYELLRVSSTREVALTRHTDSQPCMTLFGGIEYNADSNAIAKQNRALALMPYEYRPRSTANRAAVLGVSPLPGTRREVEQIHALLKQHNISSHNFVNVQASEECFKAQGQVRPTWLHIATHGFFWNEEQSFRFQELAFMQQSLIEMMGEQSMVAQEDHSLTRTGLLFAGANNALMGCDIPSNMDDGILTAQEISRMDMRTVSLVVLSACETAAGDINSEGVFGLQRGFKKAGANSIIMSLWKVDDEATCLLMTEFYKYWIDGEMTKYNALEAAKKTVRSRKDKGWDDPRYWAAFILLDGLD
ncbi:MAG: CHAT domain-containing protein [Bacteroidaceae bacterium]|nr:CHAT domain-containing protein [Bacteroidaceae bacterium]